ncbi:MAG: hypothetical protein HY656_02600 [Acidobacteria bacterium]|nr:hypothetical protein [Acidobacteriota bacterium]
MKTILVVGRDWKFRALLRAQLREDGYNALGFATLEEATEPLASSPPPVALVFDTSDASPVEIRTELPGLAARLPVVVVAAADEPLDASLRALRRPLRVEDVAAAVKALVSA